MQNQRVTLAYERKRHYKAEATRLEGELTDTKHRLTELQLTMNDTSHSMSNSINLMQEERNTLASTVEEGRRQIEQMKKIIEDLRVEAARNDVNTQSLHTELDKKSILLTEKNLCIDESERKVVQHRQEVAVALNGANLVRAALEEVKGLLKVSETKYTTYSQESNITISNLHRDNALERCEERFGR